MAVSASRVTVGTTAVALNTASTSGTRIVVANVDDTNGIDLGGADVTSAEGYPLAKTTTVTVELAPGEVLYAIGSADTDVAVLLT